MLKRYVETFQYDIYMISENCNIVHEAEIFEATETHKILTLAQIENVT